MNLLDIIIAVPLLWALYRGFSKGFIIELATLAGLILGVYFGIHFSYIAADFLSNNFEIGEKYLTVVSFAVTFIAVVFIVYLIGRILEKFVDIIALGFLNKLAGAAFGILKGALILSVLIYILNSFDPNRNVLTDKLTSGSALYPAIESIVPEILDRVNFDEDPLDLGRPVKGVKST